MDWLLPRTFTYMNVSVRIAPVAAKAGTPLTRDGNQLKLLETGPDMIDKAQTLRTLILITNAQKERLLSHEDGEKDRAAAVVNILTAHGVKAAPLDHVEVLSQDTLKGATMQEAVSMIGAALTAVSTPASITGTRTQTRGVPTVVIMCSVRLLWKVYIVLAGLEGGGVTPGELAACGATLSPGQVQRLVNDASSGATSYTRSLLVIPPTRAAPALSLAPSPEESLLGVVLDADATEDEDCDLDTAPASHSGGSIDVCSKCDEDHERTLLTVTTTSTTSNMCTPSDFERLRLSYGQLVLSSNPLAVLTRQAAAPAPPDDDVSMSTPSGQLARVYAGVTDSGKSARVITVVTGILDDIRGHIEDLAHVISKAHPQTLPDLNVGFLSEATRHALKPVSSESGQELPPTLRRLTGEPFERVVVAVEAFVLALPVVSDFIRDPITNMALMDELDAHLTQLKSVRDTFAAAGRAADAVSVEVAHGTEHDIQCAVYIDAHNAVIDALMGGTPVPVEALRVLLTESAASVTVPRGDSTAVSTAVSTVSKPAPKLKSSLSLKSMSGATKTKTKTAHFEEPVVTNGVEEEKKKKQRKSVSERLELATSALSGTVAEFVATALTDEKRAAAFDVSITRAIPHLSSVEAAAFKFLSDGVDAVSEASFDAFLALSLEDDRDSILVTAAVFAGVTTLYTTKKEIETVFGSKGAIRLHWDGNLPKGLKTVHDFLFACPRLLIAFRPMTDVTWKGFVPCIPSLKGLISALPTSRRGFVKQTSTSPSPSRAGGGTAAVSRKRKARPKQAPMKRVRHDEEEDVEASGGDDDDDGSDAASGGPAPRRVQQQKAAVKRVRQRKMSMVDDDGDRLDKSDDDADSDKYFNDDADGQGHRFEGEYVSEGEDEGEDEGEVDAEDEDEDE